MVLGSSVAEAVYSGIDEDALVHSGAESLNQQVGEAIVSGEVQNMNEEDVLHPKADLCHSMEDLGDVPPQAVVGGDSALNALPSERNGILEEDALVHSKAESLDQQVESIMSGEVQDMNEEESLHPKGESIRDVPTVAVVGGGDALDALPSEINGTLEEAPGRSVVETVCFVRDENAFVLSESESLDQQAEVIVSCEVQDMDEDEDLHPKGDLRHSIEGLGDVPTVAVTGGDSALHALPSERNGNLEEVPGSSAAETVCSGRGRVALVHPEAGSLDQRVEVIASGEVQEMNEEEALQPKCDFCHSAEGLGVVPTVAVVGGDGALDALPSERNGILEEVPGSSVAETVCSGRDRDALVHSEAESLDQRVEVIVSGEVQDMDACSGRDKDALVHSEAESLNQKLDVVVGGEVQDKVICSGRDKDALVHSEAESLDQQVEVNIIGEVQVMNEEETLHHPKGKLCHSVGGLGDLPSVAVVANDGTAAHGKASEGIQSQIKDQELEVKSLNWSSERETAVCVEPRSSNEQTKIVNEDKVAVMDNNVTDPIVNFPTADNNDRSSACSEDDQNMKVMKCEVRNTGEDGHELAGSKSSQEYVADIKEATAMEVEEVLSYEDEVLGTDDFCNNSSLKDQKLEVDKINESSDTDAVHRDLESSAETTQMLVMVEEFPKPEGDGEATVENNNKVLSSEIETVNGDNCLHVDEQNTATVGGTIENDNIDQGNAKASAEQVGVDGQSKSSGIDNQEIVKVPASNAFDECTSISEKAEELKVETLGETSLKDFSVGISSPIRNQATLICSSNCNEISEIMTPTLTDHQSLEVHMVNCDIPPPNGDQTTGSCVSDAVNSMEVVIPEEKGESFETVKNIPEGMVLNKCMDGSLVVDLDSCLNKDKEWKSQDDELVKESVPLKPQVVTHGVHGVELSEYFDGSENTNGDLCLDGSSVLQEVEAHENYTDAEQGDLCGGRDVEMREQVSGLEQAKTVEVKSTKQTTPKPRTPGDLANYLLPQESEGDFSVSDLVWGKVKSHPWWPGQIHDSADASERAMKYHKKDSFLVAYFGDRTFAWNEASLLKPFWSNFSHIEKQSNSEAFQNAISSALEEVSRRIMLGLACSCIPKDVYSKIESQIVENTGIRQESSIRYGLDESIGVSSFKPDKLVEYIRALAETPLAVTDRLPLVIAKAQLLAFNQLRGYFSLPEFQFCGGLLESDADDSNLDQTNECTPNDEQVISNKRKLESENRSSHKRKHNLKDGSYSRKRERRMSELMGDEGSEEQDRRISFYAAKVSTTVSPIPKPSFKVGDCIRRAASQLTGSPSILRNTSEKFQKADGSHDLQTLDNSQRAGMTSPVAYSSLEDMLLQLHLAARNPVKGHSFLSGIINFFSGFRDSINLCQYSGRQSSSTGKPGGGRKRRASHAFIGYPEDFEFDDVNDSYWTDMIIQNNSEEQPLGDDQNRGEYQIVAFDPDKSHKSSRRSYSRKRFSNGSHEVVTEESIGFIDQRKQDNLPTELILNFSEGDSIPSEVNLNKIFRRFGPLKETETEIDMETSRARVVFKRCSDAEVAFSSAGKFNIFGSTLVNYQLNYSPSVSFSTLPLAMSEGQEDAT